MTLRLTSLSVLLLALTACNKDPDLDEDGHPASVDCDDNDADIHPDADEICDDIDNNCDGEIDEGVTTTVYVDADGDGFGNADYAEEACEVASGYVTDGTDCNDGSDAAYPGATEVCDGIDNDCNGDADDADAGLDLGSATTWYDDADQDGYGDPGVSTQACIAPAGFIEDGTDCDDGSEFVFPGAVEVCNGVDDNCDRDASDAGVATFFPDGGGVEDVTSVVSGSSGSSSVAEFSADGTLRFCDGTFNTALEITGDVAVESLNGSASTMLVADGADAPAVFVTGDGLDVSLTGVALTGGAGGTMSLLTENRAGGGILCEGQSTIALSLDDVAVVGNDADFGGGVMSYLCDLSVTDSEISANTAEGVGGIWLVDGDHTLESTELTLNEGSTDSGGALFTGYGDFISVDLDEVHAEANWAGASNAAVGAQNAILSWSGTASTTSGSTSNTMDAGVAGGLYLFNTSFTGSVLDFGVDGTENSRADIHVADIGSDYMAGDDVSFTCDANGCGTSREYVVPDSSRSNDRDEFIKGNVFLAETDATIDSFAVHYFPDTSCVIDFYVLEDSDLDDSWDVIWSSTGNTFSGDDWRDSGNVGVAVQDGHYYALLAGARCSTTDQETDYSFGNSYVSSSLDGGFGTKAGYIDESSGHPSPISGAVEVRTVAGDAVTYDMLLNITEL